MLGQIRHKIIWKIMGIFWLMTICIILSNVLITTEIVMNENKVERLKETMARLVSEGTQVYEQKGQRALRRWYGDVRDRLGIRVLLLDAQQMPLAELPHKRPKHHHDRSGFYPEQKYFEKLLNLMGQPYQSSSGQQYYLRLLPSKRLSKEFRPPAYLHLLRIGLSFLFILFGSWWIARSISRPVSVLKSASQRVAEGDLSVRVAQDIGPRKDELGELARAFDHMAEKINELMAAQRQLFSDISHDIRTPLTRQKLAIELARESDDPGPMLDKLETQNLLIEDLLDSLLTLLRLDDIRHESSKHSMDLTESLKTVLQQAELEAASKQITLNSELESDMRIQGQDDLIQRALNNLLVNAIKYSPEGGVIDIKGHRGERKISVEILDQGPGIPEEQLTKVLEPFYRTDASRNSQNGGYGLGLSIANKIVQQHQGEFLLKNRAEGGLSVNITLPSELHRK